MVRIVHGCNCSHILYVLSSSILLLLGLNDMTCVVWYRFDIARRFKHSIWDEHDIHSRLMQVYPEVPHWWYAILGLPPVAMLTVAITIFHTELPIWGMVIALLLSSLFAIPLAMTQAITSQPIELNVICEILAGYAFEGKPLANMIFKLVGFTVSYQAGLYSGDMKLGHYMKVPPRVMFAAQTVAVVISCFIAQLVQQTMFTNIVDICTPHQKDGFICQNLEIATTASLIWGGIGPRKLFNPGAM
jgi:OPT family oligopeptide transporter